MSDRSGQVSGLFLAAEAAHAVFTFAHGAGAGMHHRFMESASERLADRGVSTFRYQFPYVERGGRRPDPHPVLLRTVRMAVETAADLGGGRPLFAGGKSMGGRMTSMAAAVEPLRCVRGIAFVGFPLHPAGKTGVERAEHLLGVSVPTLFVQGTRDKLAPLDLLRPVCERMGPNTTVHVVEGADHGFHVLKRSGRTDDEVLDEIAEVIGAWTRGIINRES